MIFTVVYLLGATGMSTSEHIHHPTPAHWKIAVVLAVLTAVEVAIYYIHRDFDLGNFNTILLIPAGSVPHRHRVVHASPFREVDVESVLHRRFRPGVRLYTIILTALGAIILQD